MNATPGKDPSRDYLTDGLLIVLGILVGWGAAWMVVVALIPWWWP